MSHQIHLEDNLKRAADAISNASALIFSSGAGMGVDSGLPDFRGENGFWKAYPIFSRLGISFHDIAQPSWFIKDPRMIWAFYGHRLKMYREHAPHLGYNFLHELSTKYNHFAITSNVDGFYKKSGFSDSNIWEVHGSIHHLQKCHHSEYFMNDKWHNSEIVSADSFDIEIDEETFRVVGDLPMIEGKLLRPNILMFMDYAFSQSREHMQQLNFEKWAEKSDLSKLVIIETGAGTEIPTIRSLSTKLASQYKGKLIRINPRDFQILGLGDNGIQISSGAEKALLEIKKYMS